MQQESIQQTLFFANFGWHPRSAVDFLLPADMPNGSEISAFHWIKKQREIIQMARECMISAQARQSFYTDQHRRDVEFQVGEDVLVHRDFLCDDITRGQPYQKLRLVWMGPFKIAQKVSSTVLKLSLPPGCRAHPVCNVSTLKQYHHHMIPERVQPPRPPVSDLDGQTRYVVERV